VRDGIGLEYAWFTELGVREPLNKLQCSPSIAKQWDPALLKNSVRQII